MSNYYGGLRDLAKSDPEAAKRCAERLLAIRTSLGPIRKRKTDGSLLLATWNIRDFDSNKFGFGRRLPESIFYIAEMLSCFDLVAVQEVNRDLSALERVMRILGREWDYIATDTTSGTGGNDERMAFVYNTEKVWFRKIAGEIVLPDGQLIVSRRKVKPPKAQAPSDVSDAEAKEAREDFDEVRQQFARTPFMVAFQSGWFKFSLCTVHIYYGQDSGPQLERRIAEIEQLAKFFAERQDAANDQERDDLGNVENYVLLGDFNVISPEHRTMQALKSQGFSVPAAIDGRKVRGEGDHFYDQIATRVKDPRFKVVTGGMIDIYKDVFRDTDEDRALYERFMPKADPEKNERFRAKTKEALYRKWRTWQMSDHSPLWVEIETDFTEDYLGSLATKADG
jgi:endonuclease/exonuclease/phosphatase family metal-dependent hydrolase